MNPMDEFMDTLQYCEIINDTTISSSGPERCSNKISILCPNCKKLICNYHDQLGHNDEKEIEKK